MICSERRERNENNTENMSVIQGEKIEEIPIGPVQSTTEVTKRWSGRKCQE